MNAKTIEIHPFSLTILAWYLVNRRDLPFRHTADPYLIWVSEVIMQQTRMAQGLPYYYRFVEAFPTVQALAQAPQEQLMRLWQGLGYYSRARNMQHTAQWIVSELDGVFPDSYEGLLKLKGIGPYTAAAIGAFAYQLPTAVVDGNVQRVLSRYFGLKEDMNSISGGKVVKELAWSLVPADYAKDYNQAIMEFGALQCSPGTPDCGKCPLRQGCYALTNQLVKELPLKVKKLKVKDRYLNMLVLRAGDQWVLMQQKNKEIWQDLFVFPWIEDAAIYHAESADAVIQVLMSFAISIEPITIGSTATKQILTHQRLWVRFLRVECEKLPSVLPQGWKAYTEEEIGYLGKPILLDRYVKNSLKPL